jgi:valyl-tRNA synthetase
MGDRLEALRERTRYVPDDVEPRVFARWEEAGIFHPQPEGTADANYSIAIPPPNVTGALHMGHALNGSIQDVLIRRSRMRGVRTKWIFGTDHAGIATQVKVEQQLASEGLTKQDLGREAFIDRVWQWREEYGRTIVQQFKRLGCSCDYEDERFTMDDAYARAVAHVFVALYDKGLIYRDDYMVNWDPGTRSAISDLEVEQRNVEDKLYWIDYPLESGSGSITIATVRPETMLADTAIAVNPSDDRYTRLIGETAILPIVGRRLPIIPEEYVDPEFGTGALKITPGHDPNDFEIGRRHGLEEVTVIGEDGRMTAAAGEEFAGMEVDDAREAVVARLKTEGRISNIEPYTHDVPHSHRSGRRIEPLISLQWFCDMNELAKPAIGVVKSGEVRFFPESPYTATYLSWLENIRPWVLSRQLWWGHRIPVYYCDNGHTTASAEPLTSCPECGGPVHQDEDVLDTWFSSALWPFATLGWPQQTDELGAFYPTDALVTARDIIFLWVARMVMMGIEFTGRVPFTEVPITSVIQAPDGRRMSKSLGTGIDPLDEIDAHGADAVRYGLLAMASRQDVRYSAQRVKEGEDLTNKLWNASRLVLLNVGDASPSTRASRVEDRWIVSAIERHTKRVNELIDQYRLSPAALELYEAFWTDVCDWYLELVKPRLYDGDQEAAAVLLHVLQRCLTLLHPFMPHVTEEIWSFTPGEHGLLAVGPWPEVDESLIDPEAEAEMERVRELVTLIRRLRDEAGVRPGVRIPVASGLDPALAEHVANLARLDLATNGADPTAAADGGPIADLGAGAVRIHASRDFDADALRARIDARRVLLRNEVERGEKKLANQGFVDKAPPEVVQEERDKLDAYRRELESLGE